MDDAGAYQRLQDNMYGIKNNHQQQQPPTTTTTTTTILNRFLVFVVQIIFIPIILSTLFNFGRVLFILFISF